MVRRLIGILLLLIGLSGLVVSIVGALAANRIIVTLGDAASGSLELTSQTLDTVEDTLLLAKETVDSVNEGLDTVGATADDIALTLSQTRPLLDQITAITSEELPAGLEAVEEAIPNVAQVAGAIDRTLAALSKFRIDETIPIINYKIEWSLGIDYDPAVPFDETVNQVSAGLSDLPARLRSLKVYANVTNDNLQTVSQDMHAIADDLEAVNDQVAEVNPLLDEYVGAIIQINDATRQTRARMSEQLERAKLVVTVVMIWLGLAQLAPLYLGWELWTGRRSEVKDDADYPD